MMDLDIDALMEFAKAEGQARVILYDQTGSQG